MTSALPLGHELEAEWRFRVIDQRISLLSMEFLRSFWHLARKAATAMTIESGGLS
jgi:hypothetical protein